MPSPNHPIARARPGLLQPLFRRAIDVLTGSVERTSPPVPQAPAADSGPLRVLVVDDEPVNLILASALLAGCGVRALVASNGEQAVAIASQQRLDLILMDLQMPVLDGFAATRQIRRSERERMLARVPVMAYTSLDASAEVLCSSGIDGLLPKPCGQQAMQDCVARWCQALTSRRPS